MKLKDSHYIAIFMLFGISSILFIVYIGITVIPSKGLKSGRAKVYVADENGTCWAANRGGRGRGRVYMHTGYGKLWFERPSANLILEKDASDKRVSKILQIDVKHCVRVDK